MDLTSIWLANFRAVVDAEIAAASGKKSVAYRAVAEKIHFKPDYVYQIYTGQPKARPRMPSKDVMQAIAREYANGRDHTWINVEPLTWVKDISDEPVYIGYKSSQPREAAFSNVEALTAPPVPVISWIQAGMWSEIQDTFEPGDADDWKSPTLARLGRRAYALIVRGESMTDPTGPRSFPEGTLIFVDPDAGFGPGDFVIAKDVKTQEATFKKLLTDGGRWYLKPLNKEFQTIEIDDPAIRVIGRVMEFLPPGGKL